VGIGFGMRRIMKYASTMIMKAPTTSQTSSVGRYRALLGFFARPLVDFTTEIRLAVRLYISNIDSFR
jgi:hypothetical protein